MTQDEQAPHRDAILASYREVCASYKAIDDFRGRLLALLPLASGAGGVVLLTANGKHEHLSAIGLFGLAVTIGLFIYELRSIQLCLRLLKLGSHLESRLGFDKHTGLFLGRPRGYLRNVVSLPAASYLIYAVVAVGWAYVICVGLS